MAFSRRSDDVRLPSAAAAADTYFTAQALRAGYPVDPIARPDLAAPPPLSTREVLQRELQKEQVRGEYLSRELAHSRFLLDQQMRHQQELEAAHRVVPAPAYHSVVPEFRAVERRPVLVTHPDELGFRESFSSPVPRFVDAGIDRRRLGPRSKPVVRERHSAALRPKTAIRKQRPTGRGASREHEGKLLKKASGIKKEAATIEASSDPPVQDKSIKAASDRPSQDKSIEAASDPPLQDKSKWSCSLCQVFATSEHDLKVHLSGRRHKVKQESHSSQAKVADQVVPADGSKKVDKPLSGKPTQEEQEQSFYCVVCKVKCTSQSMLNSHLNGKRHKEASKEVPAPLPVKEQKQPDQQKQAVKKMLAVKQTSAFKPNQAVQNSLYCDVCNLQCNSLFMLNSHLNGKKHIVQLMRSNKAQGDKPVSAEDNKLANDTAEGPKLVNDKPVTAKQTGGSGKGDKPITTKENILANNEPVVTVQSEKVKSLVITDSSGHEGKSVTPEESGKALSPVPATKRRVVKKVRIQAAVEEPVETGPADSQVSLGAVQMEHADTEVSIVESVADETMENVL